jgi:hypothetical protein
LAQLADVYRRLGDCYELRPRGAILVKGKGLMETYFLLGRRASDGPANIASAGGEEENPVIAHA